MNFPRPQQHVPLIKTSDHRFLSWKMFKTGPFVLLALPLSLLLALSKPGLDAERGCHQLTKVRFAAEMQRLVTMVTKAQMDCHG
mmetsp:Transcript_63617/g.110869  ORF Transcript_63617/g.110869 Transcript_63617/m.110869 type:complete len:84 (-) Transcript_63617:666-917(-)